MTTNLVAMASRQTGIVSDDDVMGGEPRIEGRRISVRQVSELVEDSGVPAETVADRYDLDVGDVYRALAYYHDHPAEMAQVEREREAAEQEALASDATRRADLE